MGGARPQKMTVISPAIGPVWAVHLMARFLPTAVLPRPWWLLQTRQAIALRALASAREVGVWDQISIAGLDRLPLTNYLFISVLIVPPVIHWLMFSP